MSPEPILVENEAHNVLLPAFQVRPVCRVSEVPLVIRVKTTYCSLHSQNVKRKNALMCDTRFLELTYFDLDQCPPVFSPKARDVTSPEIDVYENVFSG